MPSPLRSDRPRPEAPLSDAIGDRIDTEVLEPHLQVKLWEHHTRSHFFRVRCHAVNLDTLHASQRNCAHGRMHFADMRAGPHVVERSAQDVAEDPRDLVLLVLLLEGEAIYGQDGTWLTLQPGDIMALRADLPFMGTYPKPVRQMVLTLPMRDFADVCGREIAGLERAPRGQIGARSLRWLIDHGTAWLDRTGSLPDQAPEDHGLGLVAALFGPKRPGSQGRQLPHYLAALEMISDRLANPELCGAAIAAALQITPRHLNRIFAREGTTVAQVIEDRRLSHARHLLEDRGHSGTTIAQIAYACGFSDHALFSRKFRRQFDLTPTEARRAGALPLPGRDAEDAPGRAPSAGGR